MQDILNYILVRKCPLMFREYVFLDATQCLFKEKAINEGLRLYRVKEIDKEGEPYKLISCIVSSLCEERFLNVMRNVRYKALLLGYRDYDRYCKKMQELLC